MKNKKSWAHLLESAKSGPRPGPGERRGAFKVSPTVCGRRHLLMAPDLGTDTGTAWLRRKCWEIGGGLCSRGAELFAFTPLFPCSVIYTACGHPDHCGRCIFERARSAFARRSRKTSGVRRVYPPTALINNGAAVARFCRPAFPARQPGSLLLRDRLHLCCNMHGEKSTWRPRLSPPSPVTRLDSIIQQRGKAPLLFALREATWRK